MDKKLPIPERGRSRTRRRSVVSSVTHDSAQITRKTTASDRIERARVAVTADRSHRVIITTSANAAEESRRGSRIADVVVGVARRRGVEAPVQGVGIVAELSAVKHLELRDFFRLDILVDHIRHLRVVVEESANAHYLNDDSLIYLLLD